ncbi:MAG: flagellar hook protein FlgE [Zetaproteobacteria bacterium]|nr:flagellar hook protein FlgE [Zetaproteobacteria bacterium]
MGVTQSLYTGVTGLTVNADGMSVIANNIANASARGFKRDRAEFEDLVSLDMTSGAGSAQIGRGSRLSTVKTMHTQGGMTVTDNLTDVAIQGNGFFILSNPDSDVLETAGKVYTRAGSLRFNKDGYFATADGSRVQGYKADADGILSSRLTDIRIETNSIPPRATDVVTLNVQLDARSKVLEEEFDLTNPEKTSNYATSFSIFDSHGRAHQSTMYFRKISASEEGVEWEFHVVVDSEDVTNPADGEFTEVGNGSIKFDKYGMLLEENVENNTINFANGAFADQQVNYDFGVNIGEEEGKGVNASTSIAAKSLMAFHQQNGYEAGTLKTLKIGQDGVVTGIFTNGIQRNLAGIALATFSNQDGLVKAGKNKFFTSIDSGPPNIGLPDSGTRGQIYASSLEESNVDLANEFVKMITTQRLFQANSRSITTTDTMIEEVINLKR